MLNTALSDIRKMLKSYVGDSRTVGSQQDSTYDSLLASKQSLLAAEFDFAFLEDRWDVAALAATRYYLMPSVDVDGNSFTLDISREFKVYSLFNRVYHRLEYGISMENYNWLNSDLGLGVDPAQRWRWIQNSAVPSQRFEIWPMPMTSGVQTIRFVGSRKLNPLVSDTDKADLDDELLALSVAVDLLLKKEGREAQTRAIDAQRRLAQLRSAYPQKQPVPAIFGGGDDGEERQRLAGIKIVAVAS